MHPEQQKWDKKYSAGMLPMAHVAEVLRQNKHLLPQSGLALDLACGLGENSLFLAKAGIEVCAWDISPVAINFVNKKAEQQKLSISTVVRDVISFPPEAASFDVIVISHFLARDISRQIVEALRPRGLLFFQTYCRQKVFEQGPTNPDYLLGDNELLQLFSTLKVRAYREESLLGDTNQGWRNQAMLVAEKR